MKILGLDLGSGSIGWAVITYGLTPKEMEILGIGSRIVPIDGQTLSKFDSGQAITINSGRTQKRTARKMLDRFQNRKKDLMAFLKAHNMSPTEELIKLAPVRLWELRAKAVEERITLEELGRVLLHISQKRGYNASKSDLSSTDSKTGEYIKGVKTRFDELHSLGLTIGQFYCKQLQANPNYRVKDRVLPRQAYKEEFDAIMAKQAEFYPEVLTAAAIDRLRDYVLFYQRPLKSCKHLVSVCEFESCVIEKDGKKVVIGPKVAHRSNPLFQFSRIWQAVNNIELTNRQDPNEKYPFDISDRRKFAEHLLTHESLKISEIFAYLFNKKKSPAWIPSDNIGKGIPGYKKLQAINKALGKNYAHLSKFEIKLEDVVNPETGEVIGKKVSNDVNEEPLYKLWHTLYSLSDVEECKNALRRNFCIKDEAVLEALASIDFSTEEYGNMSEKAIKRILPYLMEGKKYSEACQCAGFRHSESLTAEENQKRQLADHLEALKKGELRQPIVEKILNQMVNLVNELMAEYGNFDEIHIELARSLKQSREEREETTKRINKQEKLNKEYAARISGEYGLPATRSRIVKMRLWEESKHFCIYCNRPVPIREFLEGNDVEVEHIIPRSLLFDDSFSNKACACRECNKKKGNKTAYDFISDQGEDKLNSYISRVTRLREEDVISKTKFKHLMMAQDQIPDDFINRQLNESQYIARKAMEMLSEVSRVVTATSGSVTDYLRHIWGWDRILHNLNVDRYAKADLVEEVTVIHGGQEAKELRIKDWSKRCDHRHHAIDALAIACTTRSIIQRLNTLNALKDESFEPFYHQSEGHKEKQRMLERYVLSLPHFTYAQAYDAVSKIIVSLKAGVKLVSKSKRYRYSGGRRRCMQSGILVPRGPLHQETVYGQIMRYNKKGELVPEIVVKYKLADIKTEKEALSIVDARIRQLVIDRIKSTPAKQDPYATPLYSDAAQTQEIRTVRCFTGLTNVVPIKKDDSGKEIGFASPGANHHVAIYLDGKGNMCEHIATFMHCVERVKAGLPAIVKDPSTLWSEILSGERTFDQRFMAQLPKDGWKFLLSMQRNEMFVLGMADDEFDAAMERGDKALLGAHLYRVQSLSHSDYCFVLHTQTKAGDKSEYNKSDERFFRIKSLSKLKLLNPIKVKVDQLGRISRAND